MWERSTTCLQLCENNILKAVSNNGAAKTAIGGWILFIEIDPNRRAAKIFAQERPNDWLEAKNGLFDLVCLLIARKSADPFTLDEALELPWWKGKGTKPKSVGKAVLRFMDDLGELGISFIYSPGKKTSIWQLHQSALSALSEDVVQSATKVVARFVWSNPQLFEDTKARSVANWMHNSVQCLMKLTEGDAEASAALLQTEAATPQNTVLKEITAVLDGRVRSRSSTNRLGPENVITPDMSPFQVAAAARKLAAATVASPSSEWIGYISRIQTVLPGVAGRGYTTTTAVLLNALAVTEKRLGMNKAALDHIKEAAPLAFFSGDLILIQQMSFNFANILWENWKIDPTVCDPQDYERLLDIDIAIRRDHGIGRDSAQAEILAAYFRMERGEYDAALDYLKIARSIIRSSRQPQDYAFYYRVTGLLRGKFPVGGERLEKGQKCLLKSARYYRVAGNETYCETVTLEAAELALQLGRAQ